MGNNVGKENLLNKGLEDAMNPSVEAIICEIPSHLNNTNVRNTKDATRYIEAILNGDVINAGGVANNPEQKNEMMKRVKDIQAGLGVVIAGDEMAKQNTNGDVAKEAAIIQQTKDLTANGGYTVNGVRAEMNEEAKNTEIARRFVSIMTSGKNAVTNAFKTVKKAATSIYQFLSIKVKGLSDRWKQVIEKQQRRCDEGSERLMNKLGIEQQQNLAYGGLSR